MTTMMPEVCRPADDEGPATGAAPQYAALELVAGAGTAAAARRWLDARLAAGAVPPARRGELRRLGGEFAREGALRAEAGDPLRLELDLVGPIARLSVTGPARTTRLGSRAVEVLRSASEWGVAHVPGRGRLVWCHVPLAA
jgi:hypothetical protein